MKLRLAIIIAVLAAQITRAAELSPSEIAAGRKIYTAKCASCHRLRDPSSYDAEKWNNWMQKMRRKARLNDDQFSLLSRYLDSLRVEAVKPATSASQAKNEK